MATDTQSYELSAHQIDQALDILRKEQRHNTPSKRDRIFYRLLNICVWVFVLSLLTFVFVVLTKTGSSILSYLVYTFIVAAILALVFFVFYSIPLVGKTWRQLRLIRRLGLSKFATMQWQKRRRPSVLFVALSCSVGLLAMTIAFLIVDYLAKAIPWYVEGPAILFIVVLLLVVTGFVRRRKARLETLSNVDRMIGSFSGYKSSAEEQTTRVIEVPPDEVEEIARMERTRIRRQRHQAIAELSKSRSADFATLKCSDIRQALDKLDSTDRLRVEDEIAGITRKAGAAVNNLESSVEPQTERVPETSLKIVFSIDTANRKVRFLALIPSTDVNSDSGH